jgi:hypothetical protein
MLSVSMLSVSMLSISRVSVSITSVTILSVSILSMFSVIMLIVIMLTECHYAETRGTHLTITIISLKAIYSYNRTVYLKICKHLFEHKLLLLEDISWSKL